MMKGISLFDRIINYVSIWSDAIRYHDSMLTEKLNCLRIMAKQVFLVLLRGYFKFEA